MGRSIGETLLVDPLQVEGSGEPWETTQDERLLAMIAWKLKA